MTPKQFFEDRSGLKFNSEQQVNMLEIFGKFRRLSDSTFLLHTTRTAALSTHKVYFGHTTLY
jgi:hypothetical protein